MGLCASIILSFSSVAQMNFALGPKVGLELNSFRGTGQIDAKASWVKGLFINLQPGTFITFQPELVLIHKQAIQTKNDIRNNIDIVCFEFPALAKFKISINNIYFPHLLIGSNIAYNIHSNISATDTQTGKVINTNSGNIRKVDIGCIAGAGIDVQNEWSFFTFDVRYGFGFNNIGENLNNAGWSVSLGVGELFRGK